MIQAQHYAVEKLPNPLPLYLKVFRKRRGFKDGDVIPRTEVVWDAFQFDEKTVQAYAQACDLTVDRGRIPVLFAHSYFGPFHLLMITDENFPIGMLGSLHLRNHLIQSHPLQLGRTYRVRLALSGERRRPQGLEIDFTTEVSDAGTLVWESVSTFLVRKKFKQEDAASPLAELLPPIQKAKVVGSFDVPRNTGRRFGLITKDINPIHMSKWLAKAFGFQRDLCHGMWALAKSLNYIRVDDAQPIRCDVAFKGPLYIENDITVKADANTAGRFELFSGKNDRPCIVSNLYNVPVGTRL